MTEEPIDQETLERWTSPPTENDSDEPMRQTWLALGRMAVAASAPVDSSRIVDALRAEIRTEKSSVRQRRFPRLLQAISAVAALVAIGVAIWLYPQPSTEKTPEVAAMRDWDPEFFTAVENVETQLGELNGATYVRDEVADIETKLAGLAAGLEEDPL